jgi:hypothetical protein
MGSPLYEIDSTSFIAFSLADLGIGAYKSGSLYC